MRERLSVLFLMKDMINTINSLRIKISRNIKRLIILDKLILFKYLIKKSEVFFFTFFYFKFILLFFYFISGYQSFSKNSILMILHLIAFNDIFLIFFSITSIMSSMIIHKYMIKRVILMIVSAG